MGKVRFIPITRAVSPATASSDPLSTRSVGFYEECMGIHYGHLHDADLGDGMGRKKEHLLVRQLYFPVMGTCWESVRGGQHFRAWKQNGTLANSGAWFIGCVTIQVSIHWSINLTERTRITQGVEGGAFEEAPQDR